jgi:hypothetical protein
LVKVAVELPLLLVLVLVDILEITLRQHMAVAVEVVHTVALRQIGSHLEVADLQLGYQVPQQI